MIQNYLFFMIDDVQMLNLNKIMEKFINFNEIDKRFLFILALYTFSAEDKYL